jgi:hypothetical protein
MCSGGVLCDASCTEDVIDALANVVMPAPSHDWLRHIRGDNLLLIMNILQDVSRRWPFAFIRLIEGEWLDISSTSRPLRRKILYVLAKLCIASSRIPSSMYIQGVYIISGPWYGGYADIYQGVYQGKLVAVKMPRYSQGISHTYLVSYIFSILYTVILHDSVAGITGGTYMATA